MEHDDNEAVHLLVVEDEELQAKAMCRTLKLLGVEACVARNAEDGRALAEEQCWDGLILDIGLPDGNGMEILRAVRDKQPNVPVLVCSGLLSSRVLNEVYLHDADFVAKPSAPAQFEKFVRRVRAHKFRSTASILRTVASFGSRYELTRSELELIELALRGKSRKEIAEHRGTSQNTVKSQVRALLHKTGARTVGQLCAQVLTEALEDDPSGD